MTTEEDLLQEGLLDDAEGYDREHGRGRSPQQKRRGNVFRAIVVSSRDCFHALGTLRRAVAYVDGTSRLSCSNCAND